MMPDWAALPVGITIATLATMVGLGGGILWTPYLIFVAGLEPAQAITASLLIQIAGMGSGGIAALKKGKIDPKIALMIAGAALPGVAIGVALAGIIPSDSLVFLLGAACLATALVFVVTREEYEFAPTTKVSTGSMFRYLWAPPFLSILTGLLSVGIGDFLVPILRNRLAMKMDAAIGTCLVVMAFNAALAAALHLVGGSTFPRELVGWAILGVIAGGQIGPRLADRMPDQTLKEIFIYGLSIIGIHILFNA